MYFPRLKDLRNDMDLRQVEVLNCCISARRSTPGMKGAIEPYRWNTC